MNKEHIKRGIKKKTKKLVCLTEVFFRCSAMSFARWSNQVSSINRDKKVCFNSTKNIDKKPMSLPFKEREMKEADVYYGDCHKSN